MTDVIQLLPDSVANQIAAGEVIQRPASVIKELVENSVDAGAKNINILVVDAGRTSIQVIDDGKGMSMTDARLAFERHATSKIRKADDLFTLQTMGFRGEALPSIAAVSQVTLKTRQEGDDIGTQLFLSGSKVTDHQPCSCPVGSNFTVESLFFNVPARRKFLKSNATELTNILTTFERIALVYPEIHFTLHSNGNELFNLREAGLRQRIVDVMGRKFNQELLPVEVDTTLCRITGFVGKPESAKKKCPQQFFFVNGRYMKHPYFAKAVQTAFDRLVPTGLQVPYFLYLEVEPSTIDVNIHPTKTEIKFENEQPIWQILLAAVKEAVGVFNDIPSIDFDTEGKPEIPLVDPDYGAEMPKYKFNPEYNPFAETAKRAKTSDFRPKENIDGWDTLYSSVKMPTKPSEDLFGSSLFTGNETTPVNEDLSTEHYQYKGQYIVSSVRSGLMLIDQHRAHVRVLYERYLRQVTERKAVSQRMLFPEAVQLGVTNALLLDMIIDEMTELGFELTPLGAGSYAINSVPAGSEGINPSVLVEEMVKDAIDSGSSVKDEINQTLALGLARRSAIPYGQILSEKEMDELIANLFACENANYTPDGKKTFIVFEQNEIEQKFR